MSHSSQSFRTTHWTADGLVGETRVAAKGRGVYTTRPIKAGERVAVWGGDILNRDQLAQCTDEQQMHAVQVEEGLYIVPYKEAEVGDFFNHSCDPNVGIKGQIVLVAMRDIAADEELSFDYATTDSSDYDEFPCSCGAHNCRGKVRGDDWRLPELQSRYKEWFSLYLQRRIAAL
jgi:hypothetical protein